MSYYGQERGGRRRQSAAASPPAVASHHPRWRRRGRGATPQPRPRRSINLPDAAPRRPTPNQERPQLWTAASGRCATRAGRQGGFGRRHAPPSHALGEAGRRWARRHRGEGPSAPRGPRWPVRHQGCRRVGDALLRTGRSARRCQTTASSPQPPTKTPARRSAAQQRGMQCSVGMPLGGRDNIAALGCELGARYGR